MGKRWCSFVFLLCLSQILGSCESDGDLSSQRRSVSEPHQRDCPFYGVFADVVESAREASWEGFGNPQLAANGARGGGLHKGGEDVFSLDEAADHALVLKWSRGQVCNGPGSDIVVFENTMISTSQAEPREDNLIYFEPVLVSVSIDGKNWVDFPHHYSGVGVLEDLLQSYSDQLIPSHWHGFAGKQPTLFHEDERIKKCSDPFEQKTAGGDHFDLDDLPASELGEEIKRVGFNYVRLQAPFRNKHPNCTKFDCQEYPIPHSGDADIDGVYARCFHEI